MRQKNRDEETGNEKGKEFIKPTGTNKSPVAFMNCLIRQRMQARLQYANGCAG
jgi:hypothetical protein